MFSEGRVERIATDVVAIHHPRHGVDFVRVCPMHAWASTQSVYRTDLPCCPDCARDKDTDGRKRYDEVQRRLMPEGARP